MGPAFRNFLSSQRPKSSGAYWSFRRRGQLSKGLYRSASFSIQDEITVGYIDHQNVRDEKCLWLRWEACFDSITGKLMFLWANVGLCTDVKRAGQVYLQTRSQERGFAADWKENGFWRESLDHTSGKNAPTKRPQKKEEESIDHHKRIADRKTQKIHSAGCHFFASCGEVVASQLQVSRSLLCVFLSFWGQASPKSYLVGIYQSSKLVSHG